MSIVSFINGDHEFRRQSLIRGLPEVYDLEPERSDEDLEEQVHGAPQDLEDHESVASSSRKSSNSSVASGRSGSSTSSGTRSLAICESGSKSVGNIMREIDSGSKIGSGSSKRDSHKRGSESGSKRDISSKSGSETEGRTRGRSKGGQTGHKV